MIDNTDGYMALLIAVLRNVPTETAFCLLETGQHRQKLKWTEEDIQYMQELKQQGMCWSDIAMLLNTTKTNAQRVFQYYQNRRGI